MHRLVHRVLAFTALLALGAFLTPQATHAQTALDRIVTEAETAGAMPEDARSLARAMADVITEDARLNPEDSTTLATPQSSDQFGYSVSLDGNRALVGARFDDNRSFFGSAYVLDFSGGTWRQTAKLTATDATVGDRLGSSVSLSGDRALVGALRDDDGGTDSGSAYVFDLSDDTWRQTAKLTATDAAAFDSFGSSVSLDGDRALIGAGGDDDGGSNSGSAYVFDLSDGTWRQTFKLTATDAAGGDFFGGSVSLSGDRALVGAGGDDDGGSNSGSAYVFDLFGGTWNQTAKLTATDAAAFDNFGSSVSLDGDRALIGASADDDRGSRSGSAYIFDLSKVTWSQTAKLTATDGTENDLFGSVSLSGDRALVGAHQNSDAGVSSGSAYVFDFSDGTWRQTTKIAASDAATNDQFGNSVSLSGDRALVGASGDNVNGLSDAGSAYVFTVPRPVSTESAPDAHTLGTVAPNPTRGTASVTLTLTEAGEVTVSVFDALGRQVASEERALAAGSHHLGVPVAGLAPGAYVVRVEAPGGASSRRLTVVR